MKTVEFRRETSSATRFLSDGARREPAPGAVGSRPKAAPTGCRGLSFRDCLGFRGNDLFPCSSVDSVATKPLGAGMSENTGIRLGIDLGGTKIEIIALDAGGGAHLRERIATPQGDYAAILDAIAGLVRDAEARLGPALGIGIGTPGTHSRATGLLKNSNTVCLNGRPLQQDLEARLGRPVRMSNDANCFALSEATDGAAAGAPVVFGVIAGTGTGAGIVVDRRVLTGPNGIAGEWGHNPLPWPQSDELPGPACYCGKHGCIETWLSGPGLARDHAHHGGERLTAESIVARAEHGEAASRATLERYYERMARALAQVINILDPDVIVIGGGMGRIPMLYHEIPRRWGAYVFSDRVDTRLLPPKHGDSSGVRGAAWLWP
jgi:fructokinase